MSELQAIAAGFLVVVAVAFSLIGAFGTLVMPDLLLRMHAASKASTLGAACALLAAAVHFGQIDVAVRALLAAAFLFLTAPIAAHMLARAGYLTGTKLAPETIRDELADRYNPHTRELIGGTASPPHAPKTPDSND